MRFPIAAASLALAVLLLGLSLTAQTRGVAAGGDRREAGRLLVTGSGTMAPLIAAMARRFQEQHPRIAVEVQGGGSARGLADVRAGRADVGMVSRAVGSTEQDLRGLPIARDGVALVVHRDNPVELGDAQVAAIFTGRLQRWSQAGGRDAPIFAIAADAGRGSWELFSHRYGIAHGELRVQRMADENALRLELIRTHPEGITYLSVGEAERAAQGGAPIRLLPVQGVEASSRNIGRGNYPLARPLTLVTRLDAGALAQAFVEFCASSQVTDIVREHDFVPYLD